MDKAGIDQPNPAVPSTVHVRPLGRLGAKLMLGVLLISSAMTCVTTGVQLYLEYQRDVDVISERLDEIGHTSLRTMSMAMWNVDLDLMRVQLQDIAKLPDIKYLHVRSKMAGLIATGVMPKGPSLSRRYPLVITNGLGTLEIGEMTAVATLQNARQMLWQRLGVVLLSQAIKTFIVSFFVLLFVYLLITRRFKALANYVNRVSFSTLGETVQLPRPPRLFGSVDEIDLIGDALNNMSCSLKSERDAQQRSAQQLMFQANFDGLTGLPNRAMAEDRLRLALARRPAGAEFVAVMFLDLDRFKYINDSMGHAAGDILLQQVARRLLSCVRDDSTVGRFSGDEFLIILPALDSTHQIEAVIRRIEVQLQDAFVLNERTVFIGASIGISVSPHDGTNAAQLIQNADAAMYKAKRSGRNTHRFFTNAMNQEMDRHVRIETQLRYALERHEMTVLYQPIVDIASGAIIGAEALLRWDNPELGEVSPSVFIPLAEEAGLVKALGEWVLTNVCRDVQQWRADFDFLGSIAVNVTPQDFESDRLQDCLELLSLQYHVPLSQLKLEVTERTLLEHSEQVLQGMHALHKLGVRMSIDDFGTGYSSLSYLHDFPVDVVKIDQSFISDIADNARKAALVGGIITLSHSLGMKVVAEGIETAAQYAILRAAGCDQGQGFYMARPMDHGGFEALMRGKTELAFMHAA